MKHLRLAFALVFATLLSGLVILSGTVQAQGPTGPKPKVATSAGGLPFTYQGQLKNAAGPINGTCSLQFDLYDAATDGNHFSGPVNGSPDPVTIANGFVTVQVTFGAGMFNGDLRYIEIGVKCGSESSYTVLSPRQQITYVPYAMNADTVDGQDASKFTYTAGTGLQLLGNQFNVKGVGYQSMLVVAKSGGNFPTIAEALNSILDAGPAKHYLVYVAPGIYTETVTMKEYVDIEGAGELATKITYTGSSGLNTGTVRGANNAELRFVTVENVGGSTYAVAIYNSSTSPRLTHVTATGSGSTYSYGMSNFSSSPKLTEVNTSGAGAQDSYGLYNNASSPTLTNVTASASGASYLNCAVWNSSSTPVLTNVTASAAGGTSSYGVYNFMSSATIQSSAIVASLGGGGGSYAIYNEAPSGAYTVTVNHSQISGTSGTIRTKAQFTTRVGASQFAGGAVSGGTVTCAGMYDENYVFYPSTCP